MASKVSNVQLYLDSGGSPVSQEVCRRLARSDSASHIITSIKRLPYNLSAKSACAANYKHAILWHRGALCCSLGPQLASATLLAPCRRQGFQISLYMQMQGLESCSGFD